MRRRSPRYIRALSLASRVSSNHDQREGDGLLRNGILTHKQGIRGNELEWRQLEATSFKKVITFEAPYAQPV